MVGSCSDFQVQGVAFCRWAWAPTRSWPSIASPTFWCVTMETWLTTSRCAYHPHLVDHKLISWQKLQVFVWCFCNKTFLHVRNWTTCFFLFYSILISFVQIVWTGNQIKEHGKTNLEDHCLSWLIIGSLGFWYSFEKNKFKNFIAFLPRLWSSRRST